MNIDNTLTTLEAGYGAPGTMLRRIWIPDENMESLKIRRKKSGETHHLLWCLTLGEASADPSQQAHFYGHRALDCFKKALAWRGVPPNTRGPRAPKAPATP